MPYRDALLSEFDFEADNTRRTLERVPEDRLDWRPHVKSFNMGELATHLARLAGWGTMTITSEEFDLAGEGEQRQPAAASRQELLSLFDEGTAAFRAALAGVSDEQLLQPWTLRLGEKVIFTQPRIGVLRGMIFNHLVHHRAQLGLYLRMNDVPVPSTYGPSADEAGM